MRWYETPLISRANGSAEVSKGGFPATSSGGGRCLGGGNSKTSNNKRKEDKEEIAAKQIPLHTEPTTFTPNGKPSPSPSMPPSSEKRQYLKKFMTLLVEMGFDELEAKTALEKSNNDVAKAIDFLQQRTDA